MSRDIAELGLAKVARDGRHVYVTAADLPGLPRDDRLRRIVADIPIRVGRSGLTLVLTALPGTASVIAQAIDQSDLDEQEGTLAGDNTLLVLFRDEERLERWLARFRALQGAVGPWRNGRRIGRGAAPPGRAPRTRRHTHEEGRPRLLRRARHVRRGRMAEGAARRRRRDALRGPRRRLARGGRRGARGARRGEPRVRRRRARAVHPQLRLAAPPGRRPLPGRVSPRDGPRPPPHRAAPRGGRDARAGGRGGARLHGQGQRPGPVRRVGPRPRPLARGRGAPARRDGPLARPGDRLRHRARDRRPGRRGAAVLHGREHLGPVVRGRASWRTRGRRRPPTPSPGPSTRTRRPRRSRSSWASRVASRSRSTTTASTR